MGEAVKPANVGVLGDYVERQIAAEGQWASMPVRAGLMRDILAELFDHRAFRNATTRAPADLRSALEAGSFLLDRLVDHEVRMTSEEDAREWHGHVTPAMARFRAALAPTKGDAS